MKIAVLGGRFDPPHIGHLLIAQQVLELRPEIDKVLLVPANKHNWKEIVASPSQRIEMLKNFEGNGIEISDNEIRRGGTSYAIDTINSLTEETGAEIFWIVGSDIVAEFHKWKKPEELLEAATFLVFPRDPYKLPEVLPDGFELISSPDLIVTNLSSSAIRKRIKMGKSIKNLVPEKIEKFIIDNDLYV